MKAITNTTAFTVFTVEILQPADAVRLFGPVRGLACGVLRALGALPHPRRRAEPGLFHWGYFRPDGEWAFFSTLLAVQKRFNFVDLEKRCIK